MRRYDQQYHQRPLLYLVQVILRRIRGGTERYHPAL